MVCVCKSATYTSDSLSKTSNRLFACEWKAGMMVLVENTTYLPDGLKPK